MNQRHSNEGPNQGFGGNPSHGSSQEQQPGGQSWGGHQGGQQSARDYSSGQQPGDNSGSQGQWGGQIGGQQGQAAPYHDSGQGYSGGHPSVPFGGSSGSSGSTFNPPGSFGSPGFQGGQGGQGWQSTDPWAPRQGNFYQGGQGGFPGERLGGTYQSGHQGGYPGSPSFGQNPGLRGSDFSSHQDLLDPDYQQWRNDQVRSFDDDYRNWRQERFRRFSDDFTNWRKGRSEQGAGAGEDRSAVLVAGPGSRAGSAPHQDEHAERQNQSSHESGAKQGGSNPSKTK